MKISSFYISTENNIDVIDFIISEIEDKFLGIGYNSIAISRFMTFLKKSIHSFILSKYNKDLKIILTLPRVDEKLIIKDNYDTDIIKIRLSHDRIKSILNNEDIDYKDYISEIFDQIETEMTSINKFSFIEYLTLQIDSLSTICISELKSSFTNQELEEKIINSDSWVELSQKSSIFCDYYTKYLENKNNKKLFYNLLRKLVARI